MLGRCRQNMPTEPGHAKSRSRATASPVETTDSEVESKPWARACTPSSSSRGSPVSSSRLSISPEPTSRLKAALARTVEGYASEGSLARNYLKFKRSAPSARSSSVSDLQSTAKTEETRDIKNGSGFRVFHSPLAGKPMTMENPVSGPQVQRPPGPPSSYANVKHRSHFSAEPLSSSSPSTKASCFDNSAAHSFPWRNSPRSSTESDMKERRPSTASGVMEGRFSRDPAQTHVPNVQKNTQPLPETSQTQRLKCNSRNTVKNGDDEKAQFSTADRTILAELKHSLSARESQFIIKNGKKHHPYSAKDVPFPRNYERVVLDHEMWEVLAYYQLTKALTHYQFETPPAKVLDLGCGSGAWILHAAQVWKQTHFTGLDIVPLHPDLTRVGPSDLANRVSWVQANFLHRLPFPENEFDFVFLKRVSRAVPEDKINVLFDEILRVMKPGGVIEILDEDLHFPGSMPDPRVVESDSASSDAADASSSSVNLLSVSTSLSSTSAASQSRASPVSRSSMSSPSYGHSKKKSEPGEFHARLLDADRGVAGMPRASASTSELGQMQSHWGVSKAKNGEDVPASMTGSRMPKREGSGAILGSGTSPQHLDASAPSSFQPKATETRRRSLSNARAGKQSSAADADPSPSLSSAIYRRKSQNRNPTQSRDMDPVNHSHSESINSRRMDSQERAEKPRAVPKDSGFVLTHVGGSSHELTLDETGGNVNRTGTVNKGKSISGPSNGTDGARDGANTGPTARKTSDARMSKVLYHPSLGQPLNPRDHSLLKRIYKEMHEARFINLTPLSVLGAQLDMYFSRVKSCAPIVFGFPPRLQKRHELGHADADDGQDDPFLPTLDNDLYETSILQFQNNTIVHAKSGVPRKDSGRRSLSRGDEAASPYIIIDNARAPALPAPRIKPRPSYPESVCSGTSNETETTPSDGSRPSLSLPFSAEAAEPHAPPPQAPAEPPEAMLEIDLKSLPMMLSSCVVDTLACAEAMWDWVLEEQARHAAVKTQDRGRESQPLGASDEDVQMKMIREITRADFDACLSRFEMDMHDNIALSDAMEQYLHLRPNFSPSRSAERKSFDTACAAWDAGHALDQGVEGDPVGSNDGSRPAVATDAAAAAGAVRLSRTIRIFTGVKGS